MPAAWLVRSPHQVPDAALEHKAFIPDILGLLGLDAAADVGTRIAAATPDGERDKGR